MTEAGHCMIFFANTTNRSPSPLPTTVPSSVGWAGEGGVDKDRSGPLYAFSYQHHQPLYLTSAYDYTLVYWPDGGGWY